MEDRVRDLAEHRKFFAAPGDSDMDVARKKVIRGSIIDFADGMRGYAVEVWPNTAEEAKMEDELWDIEDG